MPFDKGHGYQGVLLFDSKEDTVQCHFCGGWFNFLPRHVHDVHKMKARQYKEEVGLLQSTALLSESMRERLLRNIDTRKKNLVPGGRQKKETIEKIRTTIKKNLHNAERRNRLGTCPAQLLDRIRKIAEKKGRTPTHREIATFRQTIELVFGSVEEAFRQASLPRRTPGVNVNHRSKIRDLEGERRRLLEEIREFRNIHGRLPHFSDCSRKLLTDYQTFKRRFGSFRKALELA